MCWKYTSNLTYPALNCSQELTYHTFICLYYTSFVKYFHALNLKLAYKYFSVFLLNILAFHSLTS